MKSMLKIWERSPLQFMLTPSVAVVPAPPNLKLHSGHASNASYKIHSLTKIFIIAIVHFSLTGCATDHVYHPSENNDRCSLAGRAFMYSCQQRGKF